MPRKEIDYSKTVIYKIVCNDLAITDLYIGSTTNFTRRKNGHRTLCNNGTKASKYKIYQIIRNNGDWENWTMVQIEEYPCANGNEARARERYWYEQLNATLNAIKPIRTEGEINEYYEKNKDHILEIRKNYYIENKDKILEDIRAYRILNNEHIKKKQKEKYVKNKDKILENKKKKYNCDCGSICGFDEKCRHFKTQKHQNYIKSLTECIPTKEV